MSDKTTWLVWWNVLLTIVVVGLAVMYMRKSAEIDGAWEKITLGTERDAQWTAAALEKHTHQIVIGKDDKDTLSTNPVGPYLPRPTEGWPPSGVKVP